MGNYYGKYEAHELARTLSRSGRLGIELLLLKGPYYCARCGQIVTEQHCGHGGEDVIQVSGTQIRATLNRSERPDSRFMREEIADVLISLKDRKFIGGDK